MFTAKLFFSKDSNARNIYTHVEEVEGRSQKLAQIICTELVNPMSSKFQVQSNIDRLLKLGLAEKVRQSHIIFFLFP